MAYIILFDPLSSYNIFQNTRIQWRTQDFSMMGGLEYK